MDILPNNDKIERYLDELANEYKELLFNTLVDHSKSIDDISVSELLRIDNEIKKPLIEDYQRQQRKRKILLLYGLVYMMFGFFMLIFYYALKSNIFFSTDGILLLLSVVVGGMGLFISIFSMIMPIASKKTIKNTNLSQTESLKLLSYEVVNKWRELEGLVNDLAENTDVASSRSVIDYLYSNGFIDKEESMTLIEFLKMRNSIVHSSNETFVSDDIKYMLEKISNILKKLKKII